MNWRLVLWSGLGAAALLVTIGGAWIFSLPPAPAFAAQPPTAKQEAEATIAALNPPKRARPLIAIVGVNDSTETTDYLMPFGILKRADVADVVALATQPGPVTLFPVLTVEPQATIADFDAQHPEGADYVIVPAMSRDDDPAVLSWIKSQAAKGSIIVGVCAGAKVVGNTGLLDGRRATTHWYFLKELRG
jgi:putative intracellular protease/amidase